MQRNTGSIGNKRCKVQMEGKQMAKVLSIEVGFSTTKIVEMDHQPIL